MNIILGISLIITIIYTYYFIKRFRKFKVVDGWDILLLTPIVNFTICIVGLIIVVSNKLVYTKWDFNSKKK